jgi:hypothetical protein
MTGSNFMDFVGALKSDPALKERVQQARQEATTNISGEADAIAAIARDAGFDINEWAKRPTDGKSTPNQLDLGCSLLTCCLIVTSTLEPDDL